MPSRAYRVELTERAARDLVYLYEHINASESIAAARWFNRLERAVLSLSTFPSRCAVARESSKLRCLLFGRKPGVYRIIFEIDERQRTVRVLTIRHGGRDRIRPEEL